MFQRSRRGGFTLIEVMIAVAIIGTLAAIAIPSYTIFQARSRRSEAYLNTFAMIQAGDSYYAEYQSYPQSVAPMPGGLGTIQGTTKRTWTAAAETAFANVGLSWTPEGGVFYDYSINSSTANSGVGCTCAPGTCMTAAAYGDVDADGVLAWVIYVRGAPGAACPDMMFGSLPIVKYNTTATYTDLVPPSAQY